MPNILIYLPHLTRDEREEIAYIVRNSVGHPERPQLIQYLNYIQAAESTEFGFLSKEYVIRRIKFFWGNPPKGKGKEILEKLSK